MIVRLKNTCIIISITKVLKAEVEIFTNKINPTFETKNHLNHRK